MWLISLRKIEMLSDSSGGGRQWANPGINAISSEGGLKQDEIVSEKGTPSAQLLDADAHRYPALSGVLH